MKYCSQPNYQNKAFHLQEVALGQALTVAIRSIGTGPLEKKEVSQALNYAIDKEKLFKASKK